MKSIVTIILTLLFCPSLLKAQTLEEKLRELDHVMERRDTYYMLHEHRIDSLKLVARSIPESDTQAKFSAYHDLFNAYRSFQNDSARVYVEKELELARLLDSPQESVTAQYDNIFAYMSKGDFTNAVRILSQTNLAGVNDSLKAEIYVLAARLYSDLSNFTSDCYNDSYARMSKAYGDTALSIAAPGSYAAQFATYFLHDYKQNREQRIATFSEIIRRKDVSPPIKAMLHSMLGDLYISNNQHETGLIHKAQSAIMDIKSATRETTSKHFLAYELFGKGDVNRAAKYIHVALEDAENYNAPQRKAEIGRSLSLIEASRYSSVKDERNLLWILLAVAFTFVLVTCGLIIYIRKQNTRLKASSAIISSQNAEISRRSEQISEANARLRNLNSQLRESIRIKDKYLGYVFYLISEYIHKIESIYKLVHLKIKVGQSSDLSKMLPISDIRIEKEKMLKEFDRIFLSLFPTFIEQYNALFDEDPTADEPADGILTPEMRIFALIRLGITDISNIAKFLNYSVNTINTYKTKAKKRSRVSNEDFESHIMQIRSVM